MERNIDRRLKSLYDYAKALHVHDTVFIVEGGTEFRTPKDPLTYLMEHGAYTPDGRRIVCYPHPVEGIDGLSLSLYEYIDSIIEAGRVDFPALESDEI